MSNPSLQEFAAFHGMVCNPISSRRCISYFDGGALFASQDDYAALDLGSFDYTRTPVRLNLFTYYFLVIFSGTGLLTLFGKTTPSLICHEDVLFSSKTIHDCGENEPAVESKSLKNIPGMTSLVIPNKAIDYIIQRSFEFQRVDNGSNMMSDVTQVRLIRRFEYQFGNLLSVIMCHFDCDGRKYLVEVYDFHDKQSLVTRIISSILLRTRAILGLVPTVHVETTPSKDN